MAGKEVTACTKNDLDIVAKPAGNVEDNGPRNRADTEDGDALGMEVAKAMIARMGPSAGFLDMSYGIGSERRGGESVE